MPTAASIQSTFTHLLEGTTKFFAVQDQSPDYDRRNIDQLRTLAVELAAEIENPTFENFLAYLLGTTIIQAHYPLQLIRLLCLTLYTTERAGLLKTTNPEDLATAAFLADLGFRAAWLGHKSDHCEVASLRVKQLGFSWFTPLVESFILTHHNQSKDPSPNHLLSACAHYLALTYGTGIDESPSSLLSPSKVLDVMMEENPLYRPGVHNLLHVLSAYPLGSFVRLNNGLIGFVIGSSAHPLRPKIGLFRKSAKGTHTWEEHALDKETELQITSEHHPTAMQLSFFNAPQRWISEWPGLLPVDTDESTSFQETPSMGEPKSAASLAAFSGHSDRVQGFLGGKISKNPLPASSTNAPPSEHFTGPLSNESYEQELSSLRLDWEHHAKVVEESVEKLKFGLLESYKRENERYKKIVQKLEQGALSYNPMVTASPSPMPPTTMEIVSPHGDFSVIAPTSVPFVPTPPASAAGGNDLSLYKALQEHGGDALEQCQTALLPLRESLRKDAAETAKKLPEAQERLRALQHLFRSHEALLGEEREQIRTILHLWENALQALISGIAVAPRSRSAQSDLDAVQADVRSLVQQVAQAVAVPRLLQDKGNTFQERWKALEPELQSQFQKVQHDLSVQAQEQSAQRKTVEEIMDRATSLQETLRTVITQYHFKQGIAEKEQGHPAEAISHFQTAVEMKPDFWEAYAYLGICYLSMKDVKAIAALEQAIRYNPAHPSLQSCLQLAREIPV